MTKDTGKIFDVFLGERTIIDWVKFLVDKIVYAVQVKKDSRLSQLSRLSPLLPSTGLKLTL